MIYHFGQCELDDLRHELLRDGCPVHLEPQVYELLACLIRAEGELVSKDTLIERVWNNLNVSDATISARINAARTAVGDNGKAQTIIRTVPKRGFRMAVEVKQQGTSNPDKPNLPFSAPQIRVVSSTDGEPIAHSHYGSGPPLLRVGHWLSHLELDRGCPVWGPFLGHLEQSFTVYRYDQRGTGLSTRSLMNTSLDDFVEDLRAVADANGLGRFPMFAASQAVPVAIRFAARFPERISRLVLYGGYAQGRIHRAKSVGDMDEPTILNLIRAGWGQPESAFPKAFSALFIPDATPEQTASFVRIQGESISPDNAALLRQAIDRFEVMDDLPNVKAPTLVIHARSDAIHPIEQGRLLAAGIDDAQFMMLDSRNHVPLPQDPAWGHLMSAVNEFCTPSSAGQ